MRLLGLRNSQRKTPPPPITLFSFLQAGILEAIQLGFNLGQSSPSATGLVSYLNDTQGVKIVSIINPPRFLADKKHFLLHSPLLLSVLLLITAALPCMSVCSSPTTSGRA
jgi:hypothetical protein